MFWTKGELLILGGTFVNNAAKHGGVVQAAEDCSVVIEGGTFGGNTAENGGVVHVLIDGSLEVKGGVFEGNSARTGGGAFFVEGDTDIQVRCRILACVQCVASGILRIVKFGVSKFTSPRSVFRSPGM